jgi:hypothetical protein
MTVEGDPPDELLMPQFMPLHWSALLSWFFVLFSSMVAFSHTIILPQILRVQVTRMKLLQL